MKLFSINKNKNYLFITILSTIIMLAVYPFLQSFGQIYLWFAVIDFWNLVVYIVFSILFGLMISLQVYTKREVKNCNMKNSAGTGIIGTIATFFIAQCPSCAVLLSAFLPLGAVAFIVTYNIYLMIASIGLMLLSIHFIGGFKK